MCFYKGVGREKRPRIILTWTWCISFQASAAFHLRDYFITPIAQNKAVLFSSLLLRATVGVFESCPHFLTVKFPISSSLIGVLAAGNHM